MAANTTTPDCSGGDIGTMVLYPDGGAKRAGVLVVGRLHREPDPGSIENCLDFANPKPGEVVDGSNCILARRQVEFIDHVPLRLPIQLDVACAGVFCPDGQTCVSGADGVRCASAVVTCDESGTCDEPVGGGGVGGGGGSGGGSGEPTVTPIEGVDTVDNVAGLDDSGQAYALDLDAVSGVAALYEVGSTDFVPYHSVALSSTVVASHSMYARRGGEGQVQISWDNDRIVYMIDDLSSASVFSEAPNLVDHYPQDAQSTYYVVTGSSDVFASSPPATACSVSAAGSPTAMTQTGGHFFIVGSRFCNCQAPAVSGCLDLPNGAVATDVAGYPTQPLAVAVAPVAVFSLVAPNGQLTVASELVAPTDSPLGPVSVTPAGDVWVGSSKARTDGRTFLARGSVAADGTFAPTWNQSFVAIEAGAKVVWATDIPEPAAYVLTSAGKLFRVTGL